jgi:hypothetical protein
MNYLLVGATSTAGQAAISAIREHDNSSYIIGTTSKDNDVTGCDRTCRNVNLVNEDAVEKILNSISEKIDYILFTPAYGPLGFPVQEATEEQINEALAFSYKPFVSLSNAIKPKLSIGFSSFHWLPIVSTAYGSMGMAKTFLDKLALDEPNKFKIVRAGNFESKSTRGIALLIKRTVQKTQNPKLIAMREKWKETGMEFQEYFFKVAREEEALTYQTKFPGVQYRPTTVSDLKHAIKRAFGEGGPIINRIGDWSWDSNLARS